jgi:hypothetical protein
MTELQTPDFLVPLELKTTGCKKPPGFLREVVLGWWTRISLFAVECQLYSIRWFIFFGEVHPKCCFGMFYGF